MLNTIIMAAVGIGIALVAAIVVVLVIADRRNRQFESKPLDTSYGYETDKYEEPPGPDFGKTDEPQIADAVSKLASMMRLKKGGRPILLPLIAIPFFAGELVMIFLGVRMVTLSKASLDWPTAGGTVLYSEVEEDYDSEDGYTYYPRVTYQYNVDGQAYESDRVFFGADNTPEEDAYAIVAQFPAGSMVTVYYNPDKPKQSVLMPGDEYAPGFLIIFGVISIVITALTFGIMFFKSRIGGGTGADQP